jgi:aldehyde:ferredoxin oxidoreductase
MEQLDASDDEARERLVEREFYRKGVKSHLAEG